MVGKLYGRTRVGVEADTSYEKTMRRRMYIWFLAMGVQRACMRDMSFRRNLDGDLFHLPDNWTWGGYGEWFLHG
jgi:hypothetical protein